MKSRLTAIALLFATASAFAGSSYDSVNAEATRLFRAGDYPRATALVEEALAISERESGPGSTQTAKALNNLAALYHQQGQSARAVPLYRRSIAILERELGAEHAAVAIGLNNLAMLYKNLGQYDEAAPLYRRSLAIREKTLGPEHLDVAVSLNNLAQLYRARGQIAEAKPLYERSLEILDRNLGKDHPSTLAVRENLAAMYADQGDRPEILAQLDRQDLPAGLPTAREQAALTAAPTAAPALRAAPPLSAGSLTPAGAAAPSAGGRPATLMATAPTPATPPVTSQATSPAAGSALDARIAASGDWVQRTPGGHYFIQLWANRADQRTAAEDKLDEALALLDPEQVRAYRSALSGRDRIGIIYGDFADRASAAAALAQLPVALRKSRPTLRQVHQLRGDRQTDPVVVPETPPAARLASAAAANAGTAAVPAAPEPSGAAGDTLDSLIAASAGWIREAPGEHCFIQLWSNDARQRPAAEARLAEVLAALDPQQVRAYRSRLSGRERIGIIYGDYPDRAAAAAAMAQLPATLANPRPYVRAVAKLR
ncbi:tetratricopeptide repeat protein [Rhodocyclus purpureus]|uniref:tetratricopeptide repeat protein n=1 Tax=Rhodocyclus purpureus TaxID=1067 RepID=UPI0019121A7C|nr:tetratricopeptide repeat protein [Rhodocyclus purpureus]